MRNSRAGIPQVAVALGFGLLAWSGIAAAHGGGLNAEGCHNNRKTGDYHCHRASAAPKPATTTRSSPYRSTLAPQAERNTLGVREPQGASYANCSEARAAGAAPVRRGDPGYGRHLDRDNDGVGCE